MNTDEANEEIIREITGRRIHVLQKFADFEQKALEKRHLIVQAGQLQRFLRTASEFKQTIELLIESAEDVNVRHSTENLARVEKILGRIREEVGGLRNELPKIEREADFLLDENHYATEEIKNSF
uniref:Tubulin-specific chaperone A n=1 Tax=Caenorhabditis tropicalis TaxID=1561998 RepID=A0A1I7U9H9_9PELO